MGREPARCLLRVCFVPFPRAMLMSQSRRSPRQYHCPGQARRSTACVAVQFFNQVACLNASPHSDLGRPLACANARIRSTQCALVTATWLSVSATGKVEMVRRFIYEDKVRETLLPPFVCTIYCTSSTIQRLCFLPAAPA